MNFIRRGQRGYLEYKVELDSKFLSWDLVWTASEAIGYVEIILTPPTYDILGNVLTYPLTTRKYGRVFIVRYYTD